MAVLITYPIPCAKCGKPETTSWDKRLSVAFEYSEIVCEDCIAKAQGTSIDDLRQSAWDNFGLLPCPGVIQEELDAKDQQG